MKNKILKKILNIYLNIFIFFAFVAVNIQLNNILNSYGIANKYSAFIILIITIFSFVALENREIYGGNEDEKD